MKTLSKIFISILCVLMVACSSTKTVKTEKIEKKPLTSDYHLLASLLNRPMTEDQKMMLAFASAREEFKADNPYFVDYVSIRGSKKEDPMVSKPLSQSQMLIAQDSHAITVLGPY